MKKIRTDPFGNVLNTHENYRKSDGRYFYLESDPITGKRPRHYELTLEDLRKWEKRHFKSVDIYENEDRTLDDLIEEYFATSILEGTTKYNYQSAYKCHAKKVFGDKPIKEIKYSMIVKYYKGLLEAKKRSGGRNGLSLKSLRTVHTVLNSAFKLAVRNNFIQSNPCDGAYEAIKKGTNGKMIQKEFP